MKKPPKKTGDGKSPISGVAPPAEHRFKPGQSGNPEGGRAHNPAVRALKKLTVESYREVIEAVLTGNLQELKEIAEDPKTTALQVGIATAFLKALKAGDYATIERIAERIVGKIPDEINLNARNLNLNANVDTKVDKPKMKAALEKLFSDV